MVKLEISPNKVEKRELIHQDEKENPVKKFDYLWTFLIFGKIINSMNFLK